MSRVKKRLFSLLCYNSLILLFGGMVMKWNLNFFYEGPDDPEIKQDLETVLKRSEVFEETYSKRIVQDLTTDTVTDMFQEREAIETQGAKVSQYAGLLFSQDTQNAKAQELMGLVEKYTAEVEQHFSFINPGLLRHDIDKLEALKEELGDYAWVMERIIERKSHTLSGETEKILAAKNETGRDNLGSLYSKIVSGYSFELAVDGETKRLNGSQMRNFRYKSDKTLRRKAMRKLFKRYEEDKTPITGLYNNIVKDYDIESRFRNYPEPISMRNLDNETNDPIVERLIDVTTKNTDMVETYYNWKAKTMNLDLQLADIYAPLEEVNREYSFEEAKAIVLDAYYDFHQTAGEIVESFFDEKRIHSEVLPGKRGGAFCSYYVPNGKPFVMLNHNNSINDVLTMAHELGHGLHGTLSSEQTLLNYHTPLTMAEIASVFGEIVVFNRLLPTLNEKEKQLFVASTIEGNFATTFRQNMFARFEKRSHKLASEKGFASWQELSNLYNEELKTMFGNSVKITEEYNWEWATIPHIFQVPFYVYAYNFANLLVIAIYKKFEEEGEAMIPQYLDLLRSGGSDRPDRLLKKLDIDLEDDAFWQKGFDYIRDMVESLR